MSSVLAKRTIATLSFGGLALVVELTFLSNYHPVEQWWYLWPLIVAASAIYGATLGVDIMDGKRTKSPYEAAWRAAIIWGLAIASAAVSSMLIEALEIAFTRDAVAGIAKILTIIPYGPFVAVFAILNASWAIIPLALVTGPVLYALRGKFEGNVTR